ncbi:MAG: undecaprenyl/decaprenyl-phosphate alpha-N-acetylglucosaminyl 1-phosphate transferase, partial [Acidobacteria bacterium]|nr:undecaprenyl/decaprenyl-phosphate alpha-N-acetylglucosaminyl 1-phosphate transferase [Acidobacteriota bacterium]
MCALLSLGFAAFLFCLILTPIARDLFVRLELVDMPDNDRKRHDRPIPRIGGIPIVLSYAGALAVMSCLAPHGAAIAVQHKELLWSLFPSAGFIFLVGLIDDLLGLKAWVKLAGQIVAACWAVSMGARIPLVAGHEAAWIIWPLSVFWLVGCTNAFNLIDGLDGLASGVGLFATLTTLLAALLQGNWGLA